MLDIKKITCLDVYPLSQLGEDLDLSVGFSMPGCHELMAKGYRELNAMVLDFVDSNAPALCKTALPIVKRYLDMRFGETDLESLEDSHWEEQVDYSVSFTNFGLIFRIDFCLNEDKDASSNP